MIAALNVHFRWRAREGFARCCYWRHRAVKVAAARCKGWLLASDGKYTGYRVKPPQPRPRATMLPREIARRAVLEVRPC
jgi:hypothetical protein